MTPKPHGPWPPLIVAGNKPQWLWWRDSAVTLAMWLLFAVMLETEFELFFGHHLERLGWGDFETQANWPQFFERLRLYFNVIIVLVAFIAVAAVMTIARYYRARRLPRPMPLPAAAQARRARMGETDLLAARQPANVVVHIEPDGTHRVEPRHPAPDLHRSNS